MDGNELIRYPNHPDPSASSVDRNRLRDFRHSKFLGESIRRTILTGQFVLYGETVYLHGTVCHTR